MRVWQTPVLTSRLLFHQFIRTAFVWCFQMIIPLPTLFSNLVSDGLHVDFSTSTFIQYGQSPTSSPRKHWRSPPPEAPTKIWHKITFFSIFNHLPWKTIIITCVCVNIYACTCHYTNVEIRKQPCESILFFYVEVLGVELWPSSLHSNSLYLMSCWASRCLSIFFYSLLGFALLSRQHLLYIGFLNALLCQAPSSRSPSPTLDSSHVFEFPEHAVLKYLCMFSSVQVYLVISKVIMHLYLTSSSTLELLVHVCNTSTPKTEAGELHSR